MAERTKVTGRVASVEHLQVWPEVDRDRLVIHYQADGGNAARLEARYPFLLDEDDRRLLPLVTAGAALYLGQLGLARRISVSTPLPDALRVRLVELGAHLYDVRRWRDEAHLVDPPEIVGADGDVAPVERALDPDRVQLLWSGGKDSTLSAIRLLDHGYDVRALHLSVNHGVEERELAAVRALSPRLGLGFEHTEVAHEDFLAYSSQHAVSWNQPPHRNVVPFGRDLLLSLLALPHVLRSGSHALSFGHDRDCRGAWVEHGGRRFPRNDVECTDDALVLEDCLASFGIAGLTLLPPVAGLSEFAVLRAMLVDHPELMACTSFCFWPGENCGRCAKCLRYHLAQRVLGVGEVLSFAADPLVAGVCPDLEEVLAMADESQVLFGREVIFGLSSLAARGDVRPWESALAFYATSDRHAAVRDLLPAWEAELLTETSDPQIRGRIRPGIGAASGALV